MVIVTDTYAVRPPQAQSARQSRDHQERGQSRDQQTAQDTTANPTVLARQRVNAFLDDPDVGHALGGVPGWLMAWSARRNDLIIAVCVLSRPVARADDDGDTITVSRLAARPERPHNTGSWLLARARRWAALSGYDTLVAHAGVAGNEGTVYAAAGFEHEGTVAADGSGWLTRDGRTAREDYQRHRWVADLREVRP